MVKARTLNLNPEKNGAWLKFDVFQSAKVWELLFIFITSQFGEPNPVGYLNRDFGIGCPKLRG